jgi:hypothetical protein
MNSLKKKLVLCIIGNLAALILVASITIAFNDDSSYFSFGPNENLVVISVKIKGWNEYYILLSLITLINIMEVLSAEMGMPVLGFTIYNPKQTHITEFTKNELQLYANVMFIISALRKVFMIMISITQIDIALFSVIVKELTSVFTIRMLLNEKTFGDEPPQYTELDNMV